MSTSKPSWETLFELLGPIHDDVQLFARRIARSNAEGDDVFQEAVLRAVDKLPALKDRTRFKPWIQSVVVSVHRTRCRRSFWRRLISKDDVSLPEPVGDDGARWADERASASRATAALATLRPAEREAIVLFELHGYSIEEIAEIQRTSLSSVKSRLTRGRDRLRRFYAGFRELAPSASPLPQDPQSLSEEVCRG
ncbi:MAG: RNA polymerase sigma factor [Kofleriaceae bacterium]